MTVGVLLSALGLLVLLVGLVGQSVRSRPKVEILREVERLRDTVVQVHDRTHREVVALWVRVRNERAGAHFTARVKNVTGVPPNWGDPYEVELLAWEHTDEPVWFIDSDGTARVHLATLADDGVREFWFQIPKSAMWSPGGRGSGNQLQEGYWNGPIEFDFELVNRDSGEVVAKKRGVITLWPRGTDPGFVLQ